MRNFVSKAILILAIITLSYSCKHNKFEQPQAEYDYYIKWLGNVEGYTKVKQTFGNDFQEAMANYLDYFSATIDEYRTSNNNIRCEYTTEINDIQLQSSKYEIDNTLEYKRVSLTTNNKCMHINNYTFFRFIVSSTGECYYYHSPND